VKYIHATTSFLWEKGPGILTFICIPSFSAFPLKSPSGQFRFEQTSPITPSNRRDASSAARRAGIREKRISNRPANFTRGSQERRGERVREDAPLRRGRDGVLRSTVRMMDGYGSKRCSPLISFNQPRKNASIAQIRNCDFFQSFLAGSDCWPEGQLHFNILL